MKSVYTYKRKTHISKSPDFGKKGMATHTLNGGILCGHGCKYCSTPSLLYPYPAFKKIGYTACEMLSNRSSIIDPNTPEAIKDECKHLKKTDELLISSTSDTWSPEAQKYNIGRKVLEVLLDHSECQIRLLTKNAAVADDFDIIEKFKDRIVLGLSLTSTSEKSSIAQLLEPNASTNTERMKVLRQAHQKGIKVFGMLCPCIPGLLTDPEEFDSLLEFCQSVHADEIWVEPVNARGPGLINCSDTLREAGYVSIAAAIDKIRNKKAWQHYSHDLIRMATLSAQKRGIVDCLRILMYDKKCNFNGDDTAVLWLSEDK